MQQLRPKLSAQAREFVNEEMATAKRKKEQDICTLTREKGWV